MDLAEPKGLVLLQGNVMEGRGITVDEGKWLLMCLQKFYGGDGPSGARKKLLEQLPAVIYDLRSRSCLKKQRRLFEWFRS